MSETSPVDTSLRFGKHPARVTTSDGSRFSKAAVVVRDGVATLAVSEMGKPVVKLRLEGIVRVERKFDRSVTLTAVDGQTWVISKGDGCACGSPLRRWWNDAQR